MFNYSSSDSVIPSLVFTKAELVYAVAFLLSELSPADNETRIEMVELRHYLTQIRDKVMQASFDGTLKGVLAASGAETGKDAPPTPKTAPAPSLDELRLKFPSLTDEEIQDVLSKVADERKREDDKKKNNMPPPPSFVARPKAIEQHDSPQNPMTKKQMEDRANSRKFATMLGAI